MAYKPFFTWLLLSFDVSHKEDTTTTTTTNLSSKNSYVVHEIHSLTYLKNLTTCITVGHLLGSVQSEGIVSPAVSQHMSLESARRNSVKLTVLQLNN